MTSICDMTLKISFKVSFTHLYVVEVWQSRGVVLQKVIFSCVRAIFFFFLKYQSLPQKITPEIRLSKPYSRYSLFFKHI